MITGNEPAMPFEYERKYGDEGQYSTREYFEGLTIRQYFAAMFMQSILTYSKNSVETTAKNSVQAADALIQELNKSNT